MTATFVPAACQLRDSHEESDYHDLLTMLAMARTACRLTISDVAGAAGVSAQTITDYENLRVRPNTGPVTRLVLFFEGCGVIFDGDARSVRAPTVRDAVAS